MKQINCLILLLTFSLLYDARSISGQETSGYNQQARLIKVKRMSRNWTNRQMEVRGFNGLISTGKFLGVQNEYFNLESSGKELKIPVRNIESIVLKRKSTDLFLVGIMSVGAGALFTGVASLGLESEGANLLGFAAVGSAIGFTFGWKSFYVDSMIPIR